MEHLDFRSCVGFRFQAMSPRPSWKPYPLSTKKGRKGEELGQCIFKSGKGTEIVSGIKYDELQ